MPTLLKATVILKHVSGLPKNHVTNTYWFNAIGDGSESQAEELAEILRDLYTSDLGGAEIGSIQQFLSASIATAGHEIRVYPIDIATGADERGMGFPPLHTEVFDLLDRAAPGESLPSEVACCLSFKNLSSGAVPPARRRGRVYIGPLTDDAVNMDAGVPRPSALLQNTLMRFAEVLHLDVQTPGFDWQVYSRPFEGRAEVPRPGNPRGPLPALPARAGAAYPVTDWWVDNAFDTQRRRGEAATARAISS